jgi:hypothetical protein
MGRPNATRRQAAQQRVTGKGGFDGGLSRFQRQLDGMSVVLLPRLGELMYESIVDGSPMTGAPGQPEEEGDLIDSWEMTQPTETSVQVASDSEYALQNEDGVRPGGKPYVQRSSVGGRHSVKITRQGMQALVNHAANEIMSENS